MPMWGNPLSRTDPQGLIGPAGIIGLGALAGGGGAFVTAGHLIGEYNRQRSQSTEYVWLGNAPVAVLKKNGTAPANLYYVHTDHLGTPRQVTNSATNAVVWEWFGEPFGTSLPDEDPGHTGKKFSMNLRYAGQYFDKESSLFHNGFRDYNPKIGRYVQSDPIGLKGGINTYNYVGNNPINRVDPTGLYYFQQPWQANDPIVGRADTWLPPGGAISSFIENYVPAGRTLAEIHDPLVGALTSAGLPDIIANIPTMPLAYIAASYLELRRFLGFAEQPKQMCTR